MVAVVHVIEKGIRGSGDVTQLIAPDTSWRQNSPTCVSTWCRIRSHWKDWIIITGSLCTMRCQGSLSFRKDSSSKRKLFIPPNAPIDWSINKQKGWLYDAIAILVFKNPNSDIVMLTVDEPSPFLYNQSSIHPEFHTQFTSHSDRML